MNWLEQTLLDGIESLEAEKKQPGWFSISAISQIPYIEYPGLTPLECEEVKEQAKNVLRISRSENKYEEVSILYNLYDIADENKYKIAKGSKNYIKIMDDPEIKKMINSADESNSLVLVCIHNHPNNSGFSVSDLLIFGEHSSFKLMCVINTKGEISFLAKKNKINLKNIVIENIQKFVPDFKRKLVDFKELQPKKEFRLSEIIDKENLSKIAQQSILDFTQMGVYYKSYAGEIQSLCCEHIKNNYISQEEQTVFLQNQNLEENIYKENGEDSYEFKYDDDWDER